MNSVCKGGRIERPDNFLFKFNQTDTQYKLMVLQRDFMLIYRSYTRLKPTIRHHDIYFKILNKQQIIFEYIAYKLRSWKVI